METSQLVAQKIHNLAALMARESDQILRQRFGVGLSQYKILAAKEESPHLQQRAIAIELGQTEASVSRQVKLLQNKGMITVRKNPRNRREHLAELSAKGARFTEAARQSLATYHSSVVSHLSRRQQDILLELLGELR